MGRRSRDRVPEPSRLGRGTYRGGSWDPSGAGSYYPGGGPGAADGRDVAPDPRWLLNFHPDSADR